MPTIDLLGHDPFLAHFMIGQEAARQEGVSAVVDGQVFQGRAAAARHVVRGLGSGQIESGFQAVVNVFHDVIRQIADDEVRVLLAPSLRVAPGRA